MQQILQLDAQFDAEFERFKIFLEEVQFLLVNKKDELTEEDLNIPLRELVINDRRRVRIRDMSDYWDIFFAIERAILAYWEDYCTALKDRDVIKSLYSLLDFGEQEEGTLASWIAESLKAMLILRKRTGKKDYKLGEVLSCISLLISLVRTHRSSDGIGYLKWIKNFFEGKMPLTMDEIIDYIRKNEM